MAKRFTVQRLFILMSAAGTIGFSSNAMAAAFQLWEQDGASIGNYHAGRVAEAPDASTAYYNPAGMVRIHNQELVIGADPILTNMDVSGTINISNPSVGPTGNLPFNTQGGAFNILPSFHYVAPMLDRLFLGISVVSPFGLETSYGTQTNARYAATLSSLKVVDIAPSLGFAVNDKLSLGAGLDFERARGEFDLIGGSPIINQVFGTNNDTLSQNVGYSWGYGYHLGVLYQFNEQTRVGLTYHSKVTQHLEGTSKFYGPLANDGSDPNGSLQESQNLKTNTTLPATTTLSLFHTLNPTWDVMGTIAYTQWSEFTELALQQVSGIAVMGSGDEMTTGSSTSILVVIPEHYRNTWNYSIGANYHASEQWMFKAGVGYDETPSNNLYRNLQLPDSDRIALALGAHYQPCQSLGLDLGWTHLFAMNTRINNLTQAVGAQTTTVNATTRASADVFGLQAKWDFA